MSKKPSLVGDIATNPDRICGSVITIGIEYLVLVDGLTNTGAWSCKELIRVLMNLTSSFQLTSPRGRVLPWPVIKKRNKERRKQTNR